MTKADLIKVLEPFDDSMRITIYKNGAVFVADAFYHIRPDGEGVMLLHNHKPDINGKIVGLKP